MGHIRESIDVDAPPAACFALAADVRRLPEWNTVIAEVKDIAGPVDRVGSTYTTVARIVGWRIDGTNEVTRFERPSLIETKGTSPTGGRLTITSSFAPQVAGTRTTVEIDYELPGGLFGGIADKLFAERKLERDTRHSNGNFKALVEAEGSKSAASVPAAPTV